MINQNVFLLSFSGTISDNPPWIPDPIRTLEEPFSLSTWISKHKGEVSCISIIFVADIQLSLSKLYLISK